MFNYKKTFPNLFSDWILFRKTIRRPRYDKNHQWGEGASLSRERGGREHEDRRAFGQHNIRNPGHEQMAIWRLVTRRGDSEQNGADRKARQGPRHSTDVGPRECEWLQLHPGRKIGRRGSTKIWNTQLSHHAVLARNADTIANAVRVSRWRGKIRNSILKSIWATTFRFLDQLKWFLSTSIICITYVWVHRWFHL